MKHFNLENLRVGDIASALGVTTNTIRRYEAAGYIKAKRNESGYRTFGIESLMRSFIISLLRKCSFSLNNISKIIESDDDVLLELGNKRLEELDLEIENLKHLRHWLKDNLKMVRSAHELGDDYLYMNNIALKFIPYSSDNAKLFNAFLYNSPEVQIMHFYNYEDLKHKYFRPVTSLAIKVSDIERLSLDKRIFDNEEVLEYPSKRSLYGVIRTPADKIGNTDFYVSSRMEYFEKAFAYIDAAGEAVDGDICEIAVNVIGRSHSSFIAIPVRKK
ncbi:MAG: MerR family transcriptional regulator [Lachnospiraceae bacterium]|nr:MerR family transcriptional regulator [Lachnospiraceae bacterium]